MDGWMDEQMMLPHESHECLSFECLCIYAFAFFASFVGAKFSQVAQSNQSLIPPFCYFSFFFFLFLVALEEFIIIIFHASFV